MEYAYVAIFLLFLAGIAVLIWAMTKVVRSQRYPEVILANRRLSVGSGHDSVVQDIETIERFRLVTTYYFSTSGNTLKRDLFTVDQQGTEKLTYSMDPENMLSGSHQKFIEKIEGCTGKTVQKEEIVEDVDGRRYSMAEFKKKRAEDVV